MPSMGPVAEDLPAAFAAEERELRGRLEQLAVNLDAEHVFRLVVTSFVLRQSGGYRDEDHGTFSVQASTAAYFLYPGFSRGTGSRDPGLIQQFFDALGAYTNVRAMALCMVGTHIPPEPIEMLLARTRLWGETIRGSGSHSQIQERIRGVQAPQENWFRRRVGLGPGRALAVLRAAERAMNANYQRVRDAMHGLRHEAEAAIAKSLKQKRSAKTQGDPPSAVDPPEAVRALLGFPERLADGVPVNAAETRVFLPDLDEAEWRALLDLIGFTPERRVTMKTPSDTRHFPLFVLGGGREMLVMDGCFLFDELYAAYERVARSDERFYSRRYTQDRCRWSEGKVAEYLGRLFPAECVLTNLDYPDPDKPGEKAPAELDAAVCWGPFLLLVEVKAGQFCDAAQLGSRVHLQADLRATVEEAFDQATRARRYLAADPAPVFTERGSGRKLAIDRTKLARIFLLSITLQQFGTLTLQLGDLRALNLFQSGVFPFAVCLHDLDVITRFSEGPDVFLHYAERRLAWQDDFTHLLGTEQDIFGAYLENRLHPAEQRQRAAGRNHADPVLLSFMMSGQFDAWWEADRRGLETEKPEITLKLPPSVRAVLQELRGRRDEHARFIAFALLSLSDHGTARLAEALEAEVEPSTTQPFTRVSFLDHETVVVVVHTWHAPTADLELMLKRRLQLESYRLRAGRAIGFSRRHGRKAHPFIENAAWLETEWQFDETLEGHVQEETITLVAGQQLPGRNEPCFCGSRRKFKKSYQDRVRIDANLIHK